MERLRSACPKFGNLRRSCIWSQVDCGEGELAPQLSPYHHPGLPISRGQAGRVSSNWGERVLPLRIHAIPEAFTFGVEGEFLSPL